jgi:hypothetical protein
MIGQAIDHTGVPRLSLTLGMSEVHRGLGSYHLKSCKFGVAACFVPDFLLEGSKLQQCLLLGLAQLVPFV